VNVTNFFFTLKYRLQKQKDNEPALNLATMIEQRFANFEDFELPEIPREPIPIIV
jgi:hypothetical protein